MKRTLRLIGVLILCVLIAISINACGSGDRGNESESESKTRASALDFSLCPGNVCLAMFYESNINPVPSIADTELTIEAWLKSKATTLNGGIFSRMDAARGVTLYVKNNEPKLAIRVITAVTSTPGAPTPTASYIVGSGFTLVQDVWTHIAGLLVNKDHSAVHADCIDELGMSTTGRDELPHLDIYVDGEYKNCATTFGYPGDPANGIPADPATSPQFADDPVYRDLLLGFVSGFIDVDGLVYGSINAVIDEVRFWMTGRTESQIQTCMNQELSSDGDCSNKNPDLIGYWRFNEGEGSTVTDFSGNGPWAILLSLEPFETAWENGWVTGYPFQPL